MAAFEPNDSAIFDRAYGCLLGQAIGDAFGFSYELHGLSSSSIRPLPPIKGRSGMEPGQVTDDTEMAMALARSLQRCGTFDQSDVARSYAEWFYTEPPDIGMTTYQAFRKLPETKIEMLALSPDVVRRKMIGASEMFNKSSLSNGCLMRISPLGIAGCRWSSDVLRDSAKADCRLTHPNVIAQDAVATYAQAISVLINAGDRLEAYETALRSCEISRVRRLLEIGDNCSVPILVGSDDEKDQKSIQGDSEMMGYLGIALKWAFLALRNDGDSFERALINVVSRGGDTDTNGCIAGALIGACVGASKIPAEWKQCVLGAHPRNADYEWSNMRDADMVVRNLLACDKPTTSAFL